MTANQYRNALDKLGLTQAGAAEFLGVSIRTSHGYANGEPIPEGYAKLLRSGGFSGLLQHRFHAEEPGNPFQSGDSHHAATTATQSGADLMTVAHSSILSARALLLSPRRWRRLLSSLSKGCRHPILKTVSVVSRQASRPSGFASPSASPSRQQIWRGGESKCRRRTPGIRSIVPSAEKC